MPPTVNIGDAKARLSHPVAQAEEGQDVIIARDGVPAARIVPIREPIVRTIEMLRQERKKRPSLSAADISAAGDRGRARRPSSSTPPSPLHGASPTNMLKRPNLS